MDLRRVSVLISVFLLTASSALAATGTFDGTEGGFWRGKAVVLGRVMTCGLTPDHYDRVTVDVLGVAATDIFVPARLDISYWTADESALRIEPKPGEIYVFCVQIIGGRWFLPNDYLRFFASKTAADRVEGPDDPKFLSFLERLARVRAESQARTKPRPPEPHSAP